MVWQDKPKINLVLTRPREAAYRFKDVWQSQSHPYNVTFIEAPMLVLRSIDSEPVNDVLMSQTRRNALIFTSQYAVELFAPYFNIHDDLRRKIRHIFCVGQETARHTESLLLAPQAFVHTAQGRVENLAGYISTYSKEHGLELMCLFPCGKHLARGTRGSFAAAGLHVEELPIYDMVPQHDLGGLRTLLEQRAPALYSFFSPRSASVFAQLLERKNLPEGVSNAGCVCLSDQVALELAHLPWAFGKTASAPRRDSMIEAIEKACARLA